MTYAIDWARWCQKNIFFVIQLEEEPCNFARKNTRSGQASERYVLEFKIYPGEDGRKDRK